LFSNKTTNDEGDFESIEDLGYYTKKLTDEERNELRAEGFAEGFAEGYAEGRAEIERVMLLSVKYLRSENLTLDEISKILDIPIQKVLEIQQRLDRKL
jgi:flagellar biosynthesis/type III secretory pathway protein FliH